MAEKQASYIQASSHPADTDRLVLEGLMSPAGAPVSGAAFGVGQAAGDLLVVQNGTPNMSVNVGAGHVWVDGTESATQGAYHGYNDATKNLVIAASDPTNARKDLVVAKVQDAAYSGAVNAWSLAVVTGTPSGAPVEPAVPANAVVLAMVSVAALATTITNANITDRRRRACALGGVVVCTSASRPAAPYTGQAIYETDTSRLYTWTGAAWKQLGLNFNPPTCRVWHNATQAVANGGTTTLAFNQERFDTDTMHDTVTNNSRITFTTAGVYLVTLNLELAAAADYQDVFAEILLNGATNIASENNGAITHTAFAADITVSTLWKFAANDYVQAVAGQVNSGAASRNVLASTGRECEFSAAWQGTGA